jgi:phosphohistidine swiveling domain-containing protein
VATSWYPHWRPGYRDADRWVVDIADAIAPALSGGKAAGLARLMRAGFDVPPGICLTTDLYRATLRGCGVLAEIDALAATPNGNGHAPAARLAEIRRVIERVALGPDAMELVHRGVTELRAHWPGMLAVRSSAVLEDHPCASHAGVHASFVGEYDVDAVVEHVRRCWASLWTDAAWAYRQHVGLSHDATAMAVVIQRFVAAGRAGVAFSIDPVTRDRAAIVIEAAWGPGQDIVSGGRTPDRYRIAIDHEGASAAVAAPPSEERVLAAADVLQLGRLVRRIEQTLGAPADVEWAFDGDRFWIVQARPVSPTVAGPPKTVWTRANVKEVFPEVPSPLAVSYLSAALDGMFRRYHASHGHPLPDDTRFVGVFHGRPYLNLTLMQQMTLARGGDPAIVSRLFGGPASPLDTASACAAPSDRGLRDAAGLAQELLATIFVTPRRAPGLFRTIRRQAAAYDAVVLERLDDAALRRHLARFADEALGPERMSQMHEIVSAQSRAFMILDRLLAAWLPARADTLMTQLTTGLGTLPQARMTARLVALSETARTEPKVEAFLGSAGDEATMRRYDRVLAGTRFLAGFEDLLREFGHRARFESDVMSPRFREDPLPLLRIVQIYVRSDMLESPDQQAIRRRSIQHAAKAEVRSALGVTRWLVFSMVCSALQRLLGQRDENRHVTTLLVAHLRRIVLEIGRRAEQAALLGRRDDIFFVHWHELPRVLEGDRDWREIVRDRREEHDRNRSVRAMDLLHDGAMEHPGRPWEPDGDDALAGLGVSAGTVTGRVKVLHAAGDVPTPGEIAVVSAIEPSLTPLFPVVRGVIAEMGGLLSHGAILAREYGLPAVVNLADATRRLHDRDHVELNGMTGCVRVLGRANGASGDRVTVAKQA